MKILITGICGFVGSRLATGLTDSLAGAEIAGIDNLMRPGSEGNRARLRARGIRILHGDLRMWSDVEAAPPCHWVIDAAANPSLLAGVDGRSSPRQLAEHNLAGTLNVLEYCRENKAGLIVLSTSRVYSVRALESLPVRERGQAFELDTSCSLPEGLTQSGIGSRFSVQPPISLYGATKLASEIMALEYGAAFGFPVWINRCGVLAGAGQLGTAEQGIFSYWLHAHASRRPLRFIGFGGRGFQVRDAFHPDDLAALIAIQMQRTPPEDAVYNVGGGPDNTMSLAQLTDWCNQRFGHHEPSPDLRPRPYDAPWIVMDSRRALADFGWSPRRTLHSILEEIAGHIGDHPGWLAHCEPT